jgi:nitrite reductase/ring-hydroxylating ferredoxin subunit
MPDWRRAAALDECPPGATLEVVVGDRIVALANVEGTVRALDGVCPHQGGPLGKGELEGDILTCPWHGWQFDVGTGQHCLSQSIRQPTFEVKVEDGAIYVQLSEA